MLLYIVLSILILINAEEEVNDDVLNDSSSMSNTDEIFENNGRPAEVRWAQRRDRVLFKIVENNIREERVWFDRRHVNVSFTADSHHDASPQRFSLSLRFFDRVSYEHDDTKHVLSKWNWKFNVIKETAGKYWKRLLKVKKNHVKIDWPNWIDDIDYDDYDEDDEEDEIETKKNNKKEL